MVSGIGRMGKKMASFSGESDDLVFEEVDFVLLLVDYFSRFAAIRFVADSLLVKVLRSSI